MTEQQTDHSYHSSSHVLSPPQVQAKLATLNVRYRDMQETMSRLITMLVDENVELKTENATLKNQLNTEKPIKKQP
jgi:regulator of replication initiation timing